MPHTVVLNDDRKFGGASPQQYVYRSGLLPWKRILQSIRDQLIDNKPDASRLPRTQDDFIGHDSNSNRSDITKRLSKVPAQLFKVLLHIHSLLAVRKFQVILSVCDDVQPLDCALQRCPDQGTRL